MIQEKLQYREEHPSNLTPVDYPREWVVAGKTITIPPGAILHDIQTEPGRVVIVERGESRIHIDADTGRVFKSQLAPEDEAEFRSLILEPLTSSARLSAAAFARQH